MHLNRAIISILFALALAAPVLCLPSDQKDRTIPVSPEYVQRLVQGKITAREEHDPSLNKRTTYGFYQCSQEGFAGYCEKTLGVEDEKCRVNVFGTSSSLTPDEGVECTVYENRNCAGVGIYPFSFPGIEDFLWDIWWSAVATNPERDPPQSYRCQIVKNENWPNVP